MNYTDAVYSDHVSALFDVVYEAVSDNVIDENEVETARLVVSAGVDKTKRNSEDKTAAEVYLEHYNGSSGGYAELFFHEILDAESMFGDGHN